MITQAEAAEQTLNGLSIGITLLCEAIDPDHSHGPENSKIVEYAKQTRRLAEELAHAVHGSNRTYQLNKAREMLSHLGSVQKVNGGILGDPERQ